MVERIALKVLCLLKKLFLEDGYNTVGTSPWSFVMLKINKHILSKHTFF